MSYGETSAGWSVFDGAKAIKAKPDALMEDIDTAIAAIEYARATALLNLSPSSCLSKTKNKSPDKSTVSMYDACLLEEPYRMGSATMTGG